MIVLKTLKHSIFFCQQYGKNLKKRWLSLLLLFIVPLALVAAIASLALMIFTPEEREPIQLVLVDEDETFESKLMTQLLLMTVSEEQFLQATVHDEETAQQLMSDGSITSYFVFPKGFTKKLYDGDSVQLQLVGHPDKQVDSLIIYELIDSLSRYIESAQANILTIYRFTKPLNFSKEEKAIFFEQQFMNFTMFTLAKGNLLWEDEVENIATSNPIHYFSVATIFVLLSIWLLGVYMLLQKEESVSLQIRMKLLGVTKLQRIIGQSFWTVLLACIWTLVLIVIFVYISDKTLYVLDYIRITCIIILYSVCYVILIALIDVSLTAVKSKIIIQMLVLMLILLLSGAIIPTIYFPLSIQSSISMLYSLNAYSWFVDLLIKERNYVEYRQLLLSSIVMMIALIFVSNMKERWQQ